MPLPTRTTIFSLLIISLYTTQFALSHPKISNSAELDEFDDSDSDSSDEELDPGSWSPIFDPESSFSAPRSELEAHFYSRLSKMVKAVSSGNLSLMEEAATEIETAAADGDPHSLSVLGFLEETGQMRKRNDGKAFLYHYFAAERGNLQSKMALAYKYFKQEVYEKAAELYSELAEVAMSKFFISKDLTSHADPTFVRDVENEALRNSQGDDFKTLEYQAEEGNALAMYKIGLSYLYGRRGLRQNRNKALSWFLKAAEKGEQWSMEFLGEMYTKGAGVVKNYTKALQLFTLAAKQQHCSAYTGIGYLYLKGYGVENRDFHKAKEYFEKAAENDQPGGHYYLGVMYLNGIGVTTNAKLAVGYFMMAANGGQSKAFYQLAKMFQSGVGLRKDLNMATALFKIVAEKGPWSSLSKWALESYLKGDTGKALFLYSRMAELGYDVAQSNAAWILDKYGEHSICVGQYGLCTDSERHHRANSMWWQAYKQGNEHAARRVGAPYDDWDFQQDRAANASKANVCQCFSNKQATITPFYSWWSPMNHDYD